MADIIAQFKTARMKGVPIIRIETAGQRELIERINGCWKNEPPPTFQWDIVRGIIPTGVEGSPIWKASQDAIAAIDGLTPEATTGAVDAMVAAARLPNRSILFVLNAHKYFEAKQSDLYIPWTQAIFNLRDEFKTTKRTLVVMGPGFTDMPPELSDDELLLEDPLPDAAQIADVVLRVFKDAKIKAAPDEKTMALCVDAALGLTAFGSEQSLAMSVTPEGVDFPALWIRKNQMVADVPGLSMWTGPESFDNLEGYDNAKWIMTGIAEGKEPPLAYVFQDEMDKKSKKAGSVGSSEVDDEALAELLEFMENKKQLGISLIGPPGTGKSHFAKALGKQSGRPVICQNIAGAKDQYVGNSGKNLRRQLRTIEAISQGRACFVMCTNGLDGIDDALLSRYALPTIFFDLPDKAGRQKIWRHYLKAKDMTLDQPLPPDLGWVGREIRACVDYAWRTNRSVLEAGRLTIPRAKASKDIEELRKAAHKRYVDATLPEAYTYRPLAQLETEPARGRAFGEEE